MASAKIWKSDDPAQPQFPADFEILKKAVLQVTDLKTNRNKYYAIELHRSATAGEAQFRVFTHYGRTDDLEVNPDAGQKECRYCAAQGEAEALYQSIYREKTSPKKGYQEIALASSKIGSQKAQGQSVGEVDSKTLARLAKPKEALAEAPPASQLAPEVQALVRYLYDEATRALTQTVQAKITAQGIETPLGILTIGQIEKGERILESIYSILSEALNPSKNVIRLFGDQESELERLSGELYTVIPHRIGRTRAAIKQAVILGLDAFQQKQETLQLMKDMLQVNGEAGNVLFDSRADAEYKALKCEITALEPRSALYQELESSVLKSQIKRKNIKIHNIYTLRRADEWDAFNTGIGNERLLFHGSKIQNWVGILSRGILLPKIVVNLGVTRTDAGWLGNGIYFGDAACTSYFYTSPGHKKTRFMALTRVALGRMKDYTKITYGLAAPPEGYDSCHGVRRALNQPSEFDDDEYVVYQQNQQRLEYLVEMS